MQRIEEALAYIHGRPKAGKKDSFTRLEALMTALDHPEDHLPETIHITGTNGKGSVATMVTVVAQAAGLRVGTFTSPFMTDFRERFQINGELITPADLIFYTGQVQKATDQVEQASAGQLTPTEFEVVTAIMFLYFADQDLDLAVVEVGIGGRFDSTNILKTTKVAVITTVALDHQAMLGDTIAAIAGQKAGIIKPGAKTVIGPGVTAEAKEVIEAQAQEMGSPVLVAQVGPFQSALPGSFQADNTATAVLALKTWRPDLQDEVIQAGLNRTFLAGRFEQIQPKIYLDGAHNQAGIQALHQSIKENLVGPVTVIIGSLADKNVDLAFLELEQDPQITLALVTFDGVAGRPGLQKDQMNLANQDLIWYDSLDQAFSENLQQTVVITGSLYFISDVRRKLCQKKS
ncbi:bifunctional folylpolyglutamate synthase/dihydrofolate synthase [Fructobacillus americanaquae]|uniref:Bifunctional folylpolyglutamate synthase/dihydrofolate synthase n=1 Tax=Fructobacillus americanaquae TaxID=2940302 RepID=A0ABY5C191_9LACO|nr:folylpolyglutamate synthase/dihydrofolate synthase family protein [Fructobacillus americanaquae]USS92495.1 bifunctional folylpolyglutamate synthase/dihydrofolate synthase [Fructobacillus americanaquae]